MQCAGGNLKVLALNFLLFNIFEHAWSKPHVINPPKKLAYCNRTTKQEGQS
jgi:hypothetical protein